MVLVAAGLGACGLNAHVTVMLDCVGRLGPGMQVRLDRSVVVALLLNCSHEMPPIHMVDRGHR